MSAAAPLLYAGAAFGESIHQQDLPGGMLLYDASLVGYMALQKLWGPGKGRRCCSCSSKLVAGLNNNLHINFALGGLTLTQFPGCYREA